MSDSLAQQNGKLLSIDEILAADDTKYTTIHVPEWGGSVRLGSLDAGTMIDFIEMNDGPAKKLAGLRLIVRSLVDDDGNRVGTDNHIAAFKKKGANVCSRLIDEVLKLNELDKKQAQLDEAKNASGEAVSAASPTASL